jgi:nitrogen fixation/metabolism regulation signal transduction histidine kinase
MTIAKDTFLLFIVFLIYVGGDIYTARIAHQKLDKLIKENEEWSTGALIKNMRTEGRIDSLKAETEALAKTVIYLDSCQQAKTIKQDRAEKRGKFVGGLLKGLFPGL